MLCDLGTDAAESCSVADRHAEVTARLADRVERWKQDWLTNPRGWK
jgi:hypothetical protein